MTQDAQLRQIIEKISAGDKSAFSELYQLLERPLYKFIHLKLNDPHQSADILHDVFIEVWKGAKRFEGRSTVKTWIFSIAYRKIMDVYRKKNRIETMAEVPEVVDESPQPEELHHNTQRSAILRYCLDKLKQDHRTAIELAFFEDLGYREISEIVGAPEGTVKTRVYHAKSNLMNCLSKQLGRGDV